MTVIVTAVMLILAGVSRAEAQRLNYPYCAVYSFRTVTCAFNTMQQCLMTVSGVGGYCERNAWYQPVAKSKMRRKAR